PIRRQRVWCRIGARPSLGVPLTADRRMSQRREQGGRPARMMTFEAFARLHRPGQPFLLPNAWDYGSAALLAAHGFPAVGTTSLGVAAACGRPDGAGATRDETVALARSLSRLPCLLTVDIEGGFSD